MMALLPGALRTGFFSRRPPATRRRSSSGWQCGGAACTPWEALCQAGKWFGLKPFGVEAQRILRLEKGHLLFGVDTDALSNPLEAGLEWLVRFDKPAFHGREPLLQLKARGPRSRLVGFNLLQSGKLLCRTLEGYQVVEEGRPAGRGTSMRFRPTLNQPLGLA